MRGASMSDDAFISPPFIIPVSDCLVVPVQQDPVEDRGEISGACFRDYRIWRVYEDRTDCNALVVGEPSPSLGKRTNFLFLCEPRKLHGGFLGREKAGSG